MKLPTLPDAIYPAAAPLLSAIMLSLMALSGIVILLALTCILVQYLREWADRKALKFFLPAAIVLGLVAVSITGPLTYASTAQDRVHQLAGLSVFRHQAELQYGVQLSEAQAEKLALHKPRTFTPGLKAYGQADIRVKDRNVTVGLYRQGGRYLLVNQQQLAQGILAAVLPRVMR